MTLKDDVDRVLRDGSPPMKGAKPGYTIREAENGTVEVEYPDDREVTSRQGQGRKPQEKDRASVTALSPGDEILRCEELLHAEGFDAILVPGQHHSFLIVRGLRAGS